MRLDWVGPYPARDPHLKWSALYGPDDRDILQQSLNGVAITNTDDMKRRFQDNRDAA